MFGDNWEGPAEEDSPWAFGAIWFLVLIVNERQ